MGRSKKKPEDAQPVPEAKPSSKINWPRVRPKLFIGGFIAAAATAITYAIKFAGSGFTWHELENYVYGLVSLGIVLAFCEFFLRSLNTYSASRRFKNIAAYSALFLAIVPTASVVFGFSFAMLRRSGLIGVPLRSPPNPIPFVTAYSYRSENLPDAYVGSKLDDKTKARHWMDIQEKGAASDLDDKSTRPFWLFSQPFGGPTVAYTATVVVNTKAPIAIEAWTVSPRARHQLTQSSGQGPNTQYHFKVPETAADERLMVFIGMNPGDYDAIDAVKKFDILSAQ